MKGLGISWFENDADTWTEHVVSNGAYSGYRASVGDLDGDGDLDMAVGSDSFLDILINDGEDQTWSWSIHDNTDAWHTAVVDFDHDGDLDIVCDHNDFYGGVTPDDARYVVGWWKNTGTGWQWNELAEYDHKIQDLEVFSTGLKASPNGVAVSYALSDSQRAFAVMFHDSRVDFTWHLTLFNAVGDSLAICTTDYDGDGEEDIVYDLDGTIGWYSAATNSTTTLAETGETLSKLRVADMDGDGVVDVVGHTGKGVEVSVQLQSYGSTGAVKVFAVE